MSIKSGIIKILPKSILNGLKIWRDRMQLAREKSKSCDASSLAQFSANQLDSVLGRQKSHDSWQLAESTIQQFSIPNMTGGINPGDRRALFYLVSYLGATNVLEIGTHIGASTIHIAAAVHDNATQQGKQPSLTTVDIADVNDSGRRPWLEHGSKYSPKEMMELLSFDEFVKFVNCRSLDFLRESEKKFDLIFLDGNHSAVNTYREIPIAMERLTEDGVILLHDYFPNLKPLWSDRSLIPGPFLAVNRFVKEGNTIDAVPVGQLPWQTKLESNMTTLAVLTRV